MILANTGKNDAHIQRWLSYKWELRLLRKADEFIEKELRNRLYGKPQKQDGAS